MRFLTSPLSGAGRLSTSMALLIGITGCGSLAPAYQRPTAAVPAASVSALTQDPDAIGRTDFFTDARLRATVELALANNRDLRAAALTVQRARAQYRIQEATQQPAINADGVITRANQGEGASATLQLAAFELDLFGRVRNLTEAAQQSWLASAAGQRSTQLGLVADTAQAWLTLAADLARQRLATQTLESRQASLALDERRHVLGSISGLALAQSRTQLATARQDLATFAAQVVQDRDALELLLGTALPPELAHDATQNDSAATRLLEIPAGVPSDVLQRRPDVLQAEHQLQASVASIGAARAARFPRISLTAAAGSASEQLSGLFKSGTGSWSFGPSVSLPVLDGGASATAVQTAGLDRDIALAQYDKAVQTAFREVADVLAVRASLVERLAAQNAVVTSAERQLALAEAQHHAGSTGQLELLDARRTLYIAQQAQIALRLIEQSNRLQLYKVLGGGWIA